MWNEQEQPKLIATFADCDRNTWIANPTLLITGFEWLPNIRTQLDDVLRNASR